MNARELDFPSQTKIIPIVFNVDNNYIGYFYVALQSIIDTANKNFIYDIIILETNISKSHKRIIQKQISRNDNFSVRYIQMNEIIEKYNIKAWWKKPRFTYTVYYALFIPILLNNYSKVIYLDCDIIVLEDISKLYNIDIGENLLGAVIDYGTKKLQSDERLLCYLKSILSIDDISSYINSGVVIYNIAEMQKRNLFNDFMRIGSINYSFFHDQNILNSACKNSIKFLDRTWNVQWHCFKDDAINMLAEEIEYLFDNAKILHYTTEEKPIEHPDNPYSLPWWKIAKKTEYCELMFYAQQKNNMLLYSQTLTSQLASAHTYMQARLDDVLQRTHFQKITALCFGMGSMAENILPILRQECIAIKAFIDERPAMRGTSHAGSPVMDFNQIVGCSFDYILVACRPVERVSVRLRDLGISAEKIVPLDVENFFWQQDARDKAGLTTALIAFLRRFPGLIQAIDVPALLESAWITKVLSQAKQASELQKLPLAGL